MEHIVTSLHDSYIRIDGELYLLARVTPETKRQLDKRAVRIDYLKHVVGCLRRCASHLRRSVNENTSEFQHIIVANYVENAKVLLGYGALADSLTLLRPSLEYMLDNEYLRMWPSEAASYHKKVMDHNAQVASGGPQARDPNYRMRFINVKTMTEKILKHEDCTDIQRIMVQQYNLFSNVVDHASPERKNLSLRRTEDWEKVIGQIELTAFYAVEQLCSIAEVYSIIQQDDDLTKILGDIRASLYFMISDDSVPVTVVGSSLPCYQGIIE